MFKIRDREWVLQMQNRLLALQTEFGVTAADKLRTGSGAMRPENAIHRITCQCDKMEQIRGMN